MSEPLFSVPNHHVAECGDPPIIDGRADPGTYLGYFENVHGEQWVFKFNSETGTAELRGGDAGWNEVYHVVNGNAPGLILEADEAMWLQACWSAAAGRSG